MNREEYLPRTEFTPHAVPAGGDKVVMPNHYGRHSIEPIRFSVENYGVGFLIGNAVKYLTRYDAKDGHKDLAKAARYVEMLRRYEAGDPNWFAAAGGVALNEWNRTDQGLRTLAGKAPGND